MSIAVVDFGSFALGKAEPSANEMKRLSTEITRALNEYGFVYLRNTGINEEQVFGTMDICRNFFLLPKDIKQQYVHLKDSEVPNHGWYDFKTESLNPTQPKDLKESFNVTTFSASDKWPVKDVPEFTNCLESLFKICAELSIRVLKVIELSLGVESGFFVSKHQKMGRNENLSTLRAAYYPPLQKSSLKENQTRCGEHSDYGTFTLLFQDKYGGLEVMSRSGQYITAPYLPNTVLLNIANLLQRWTSDRWISTKHRVQIPQTEDALNRTRQSLAFFVHPDHDAIITCCDGLDKYPPITSIQYLKDKHPDLINLELYPSSD
ncbi:uncharacterized protein LOC127577671 [Pristis pectinata]|uniref:uncharacterized protein LOC127577671 n=1 Tax=Pristis pectinata TaxID=685728 RepID=UPI00223D0A58|nr:uncharacterized protein LOC127577671 [Pristis pectinata]XP_051885033.1 uncharacterized protein LOC127577671 [Pristis pectinata]